MSDVKGKPDGPRQDEVTGVTVTEDGVIVTLPGGQEVKMGSVPEDCDGRVFLDAKGRPYFRRRGT